MTYKIRKKSSKVKKGDPFIRLAGIEESQSILSSRYGANVSTKLISVSYTVDAITTTRRYVRDTERLIRE